MILTTIESTNPFPAQKRSAEKELMAVMLDDSVGWTRVASGEGYGRTGDRRIRPCHDRGGRGDNGSSCDVSETASDMTSEEPLGNERYMHKHPSIVAKKTFRVAQQKDSSTKLTYILRTARLNRYTVCHCLGNGQTWIDEDVDSTWSETMQVSLDERFLEAWRRRLKKREDDAAHEERLSDRLEQWRLDVANCSVLACFHLSHRS